MERPRILAKVFWPCFVLVLGMLLLGKESLAQEKPTGIGDRPASTANAALLEKILTDRELWEDDAFAVFGSLDRWKNAGVTSIIIYPEKVAAGTKSETLESAKQSLTRTVERMKPRQPRLRSKFDAVYHEAVATKAPNLKAEVIRFLEDDSFRVVWRREGGEFLKKGVKVSAVFDAYGKPQRTTTQVVHSRGDRRPAVLTLYHYANDAIRVVESDLGPTPGVVDRVVVNVAAAAAQIFEGPP